MTGETPTTGQILWNAREGKYFRIEQISELPGRAYVRPVRYSNAYGIVRNGHAHWATITGRAWTPLS